MTQVFFYHGAQDKLAASCSLIGKVWGRRKAVLIFAPQPGQADEVDRLMWTQAALSFIPHCRADSPLAAETPILIATSLDAPAQEERLLNLGLEVPPNFSRFTSLIEVVGQEDADRNAARERVRFYKERGHAVQYFDLSAS